MSTIAPLCRSRPHASWAALRGELIGPDDSGYDEARAVYNAMIDRRPALIARCTSTRPTSRAAIALRARARPAARRPRRRPQRRRPRRLRRRRRHRPRRACRTSRSTPAPARSASAAAATWGEVDAATHEHGLATPCGIISTTGVGGLTLGGGIGHLTRQYGLTIDNLLAAEVVLADGSHRAGRAPTSTPTCSGRCAAAAATSASSRRSCSGCTRSSTVVAGPTFWPLERRGRGAALRTASSCRPRRAS